MRCHFRERELAKVTIKREDVELIVSSQTPCRIRLCFAMESCLSSNRLNPHMAGEVQGACVKLCV